MDFYDTPASLESAATTLMPKYEEQRFVEFKIARAITIFGFPILILTGTISNMVSLLILRCKTFRSSSVSFSLSVLSLVNLCILYVAVLRLWILELTDRTLDVRVTSFGCKTHVMLTYLLCHMSSWTLVLIVMERTLIVCFPLAAKPYCSRRNTMLVWCVTSGVLILVNCHFFWTFGYIPDPTRFSYFEIKPSKEPMTRLPLIFKFNANDETNTTTATAITTAAAAEFHNETAKEYEYICYAHKEYFYFVHAVWPWIDALVISVIPFLLLLAGNLAIVVTISKAVKFRKESTSRLSSASSNQKTNSVFSEVPQQSSCGSSATDQRKTFGILRSKGNRNSSSSSSNNNNKRKSKKTSSCCSSDKNNVSSSTYMLLGASFLFLLLTTPSGVYLLVSDYLFESDGSPGSVAKYRLCFAVTNFLYYLNNSVNFFIYYLTGSRFRKSFRECFSSRDTLDSEGRQSDGAFLSTVLKTKLKALNAEFRQNV